MNKDRLDRRLDVKLHDPYMDRGIYKDPTVCSTCGLVYHNKTWKKDDVLKKSILEKGEVNFKDCPACRKIKDNFPLGVVDLTGFYLRDESHRTEIINLIKHESEKEENSNPLARIIEINSNNSEITIKTTTEGLASRLGKAVQKAHKGELDFKFSDGQKFLRIVWRRD